jgi:class 3 adenylate cyclase/predicted ATPase
VVDIAAWLREVGLERYEQAFREHGVDAERLAELTADDLIALGVTSIGHRRKLLAAIAARQRAPVTADPVSEPPDEASAAATAKLVRGEAERRQLTVMSCSLVGSAQLAGQLDPEQLHDVICAYHGCVAAAVGRFEGHVTKVMGDSMFICFGYPKAHEDDAERAIRAGLAVTEAVHQLRPGHALTLQVRIGIATGLVMVRDLMGADSAHEQAVVGATPNLAARLRDMAAPNSVVIAGHTRRLVRGLFAYADLGAHDLQGFDGPVQAWRVLGPGRTEDRFEALHGERLTPLVGREAEVALLLSRWRRAKDGEGHVLLLGGEPGVGKSRLVHVLREQLRGERHALLCYQCSPHHVNSALHPVMQQVERACGFERDDTPKEKLSRLEDLLGQDCPDVAAVVPLIAALLSIPTGDNYPRLDLTPRRQKERTLEALVDQIERLAQHRPALLILEDAQWIDPTSLELVERLVERVRILPALLIVTFRPGFQPPWARRAHATALTLGRLGRRLGAVMAERVAGKALPDEVLDQIAVKTDGMPLFIEELTKAVLEAGILREERDRYILAAPLPPLAIPASLQDSLMARLGRAGSAKRVAQVGAAIGREFRYELLKALTPCPEARLQKALDRLVEAELIFRRGTPPAASYTFKHALVRDAAYASLLRSTRRELHARIAEEMEAWIAKDREPEPELLAHHLSEAGLAERAVVYWHKAGQRAVEQCANVEAIAHFKKGLGLLQSLPDSPPRIRRAIELLAAMGVAIMTTKGFAAPEAGQAYAKARALCERIGEDRQLFSALQGLWYFHTVRGELPVGRDLGEQYLARAQQSGDPALLLVAHHLMGGVLCWLGELGRAEQHYEQGVLLSDMRQDRCRTPLFGADLGVLCRTGGCHTLWLLGHPDQALGRSREGLARARSRAYPFILALALDYAATLHQFRQEVAATRRLATTAGTLCREQGFAYYLAWATALEGWALAKQGQCEEGVALLRAGLAAMEATGAGLRRPYYLALLADALGGAGQPAEALAVVSEALAAVEQSGERWWEAELCRLKSHLLLAISASGFAEAEAYLRRAIQVAQAQAAKSLELRAATSLAKLWAEQGKRSQARDLLAPVYGWFTEGLETADLKAAKSLLDELR